MATRRLGAAGLVAAMAVLTGGALSPVRAEDPGGRGSQRDLPPEREREDLAEFRAAFGLHASSARISELLLQRQQVTPAERLALDLPGREVFQSRVDEELAPFITRLPTFGGAWYDQRDGGRLVVMLTELDDDVTAEIERLVPEGGKGVRIVPAARSHASLRTAMHEAWGLWAGVPGAPPLTGVGIDTRANRLEVRVDPVDLHAAGDALAALEAGLGMSVTLVPRVAPRDTTCQDRDHCEFPLVPGIRIAKGDTSVDDCTIGMHVYSDVTDDVSFVTAGHCGYSGGNSWYHEGYHGSGGRKVGTEIVGGSLLAGGFDIMVVSMEDNEATTLVYSPTDGRRMFGFKDDEYGFENTIVWTSRGHSDVVQQGIVTDADDSWVSDKGGNVTVFGLDTTLSSLPGDSGSPVWAQTATTRTAVGILNNSLGNVTLIDSCYERLGNACYPYPGGPGNKPGIVEGDFTGDGAPDLVTAENDGQARLYPHTPAGFGTLSPTTTGWQLYTAFTAADFTGDGHADVIARGGDGRLYLHPHQPAGWLARQTIGNGGWNAFGAIVATDFTGDGNADLVAQEATGALWLYPHTPAGFGTRIKIGTRGWQNMAVLAAADFSADGADDLIAVRNDGAMLLYGHTAAGFSNPVEIGKGWQNMTIILGSDFDGDGSDDIVARHENGNLYLYRHPAAGWGVSSIIGTGW
ncbi:MAG: hypothetical protein EPO36_11560 [Chloroflexota bacterium]|nr:MAG: hypothetical protein EPO36_11560 [Chloroflexota bacterium]